MTENVDIKPGQWITIGKNYPNISAVVIQVYDKFHIEVVYLDRKKQAINEDVIWSDDYWDFKNQGPSGGYADKSDRLKGFVSILRGGRNIRY